MSENVISIGSLLFLLLSYLQPFSALFTDSYFDFGIEDFVIPIFFPLAFSLISLGLALGERERKIRKILVGVSVASVVLHLIFTIIIISGS